MFDMKEEIEVDPQFIAQLMEQLDVFISIKPKPKQPSKVGSDLGPEDHISYPILDYFFIFIYMYIFIYMELNILCNIYVIIYYTLLFKYIS